MNYIYDELYHHGVKGMKWGVRRFQNADGSLTPAGQKRKARQDASDAKYRQKQLIATERYYENSRQKHLKIADKYDAKYKKTGKEKYKNLSEDHRTGAFFDKAFKKMELEKVRNLTHDEIHREKVAVGKAATIDALLTIGVTAISLPTTGFVYGHISSPQSVRSQMRLSGSEKERK